MLDSQLQTKGHKVQQKRIRKILKKLTPVEERRSKQIKRREYFTRAPHSLVHLDSYHKLIRSLEKIKYFI